MTVSGNIEVCILINGRPVMEYDDPLLESKHPDHDGTSRLKKYETKKFAEVQPGATFAILCRSLPSYRFERSIRIGFEIKIDGVHHNNPLLSKGRLHRLNGSQIVVADYEFSHGGSTYAKQFQFSALTFDAEEDFLKATELHRSKVGKIEVKVWREKFFKRADKPPAEIEGVEQKASEKLVKGLAIDCATKLTAAAKIKDTAKYWTTTTIGDEPIAYFEFLYRSHDALIQLGVIERPRSPTPLEDRDPETLSVEEKLRLFEIYKAREEARKAKVKDVKKEETLEQLRSLKRRRSEADEDDDIEEIIRPSCFPKRQVSIHDDIL